MLWIPFSIGLLFISIHFFASSLVPADRFKQLKWFSFSGGLAVSYIFIYLFPTLHKQQSNIEEPFRRLSMESEIYFAGLVGVVLFVGIQKIIQNKYISRTSTFWSVIAFYSFYNAMVSYSVLSLEVSVVQAVFYSFAIGPHFVAVAHDMWRKFPAEYSKYGRYLLAAGIITGWVVALTTELTPLFKSIIFSLVSGAMIYTVFKHELPDEKETHFPTFFAAILIYSIITMSLKFFFKW